MTWSPGDPFEGRAETEEGGMRGTAVMVGVVVAMVGFAFADAKSDLEQAKRDFDSLKSKVSDVRDKSDRYLETSRALRSMDKEQLDKLVEQLCRLDIEPNDDDVERLVRELREKAVEQVRREYDRRPRPTGASSSPRNAS